MVGFTKEALKESAKWAGWFCLWYVIEDQYSGYLGPEHAATYAAGAGLMLVLEATLLPSPVVPIAASGAFVLRAGGILCAEPALHLWACAFTGMIMQGTSHFTSRQQATLLSLEKDTKLYQKRITFEWSHVTHFPNLLLQSCYQSYKAPRPVDKVE
jgi:hypothetical protein